MTESVNVRLRSYGKVTFSSSSPFKVFILLEKSSHSLDIAAHLVLNVLFSIFSYVYAILKNGITKLRHHLLGVLLFSQ